MTDQATKDAILRDAQEIREQIQNSGVMSVKSTKKDSFWGGQLRIASRLRDLAEIGERETFRRLVDACIDYTTQANPTLDSEEARMETLSYIEHLCFSGDNGYMAVGLYHLPGRMGKTQSLLLELYDGQMPHNRGYKVQHKIEIFSALKNPGTSK